MNLNYMSNHNVASSGNSIGALLRDWRKKYGRSQLELSLEVGVSQRHISFIESGRSVPSRAMLMALAQSLNIPLRDRNNLFLAAGFAPIYADPAWNAAEMRIVNRALERMLKQHEPYPAVVMDRYWNVLLNNEFASRFFGSFIDLSKREKPRNLLHLIFDPDGMRPFIDNWDAVARGLFERISREAVGGMIDEKTRRLMSELLSYPDVDIGWSTADLPDISPVIPVGFIKDGKLLNYFSMVSTVGTPQTISAQELRVECMFPADDFTEVWHLEMFGKNSKRSG
ncbi:helix-turn-helix transcriptional regulator [Pseudomonas sp. 10B1]|uniref:helix-turn-helix domain-containing protein n=1 Tax=unclassified Pseudomonas TaxID=196821 RepID=UPI002AB54ADD|nr:MULTISPECIES: helix-turn-helix transcriptional regulator [unclassified Pseudomonas]MDY7560564.1 helix-turn-helix transcriptional regulator [Pseudomonas sp. AB6]MEA9975842.1 helix-turn-helix transcriptional regulator [Pseudomonas sp. RTS4]MEA9993320.1 helix-turn-helix transcriptional regulator [Pseudomonas sp. AA4]MEB0088490.1 helix-turn-helix transcriptional regulator [Pseudomonas sp. RTI1]MEB0124193.1 helix-turn-helix transcriptional regulator [Pseudomonas sp. CCC1.2]